MQCCGNAFSVGSTVGWAVAAWSFEPPPIVEVPEIDYYYDEHSDLNTLQLEGIVIDIKAVYQMYELDAAKKVLKPVSGKLIEHSGEATGWNSDQGDHKFAAYLVSITMPVIA